MSSTMSLRGGAGPNTLMLLNPICRPSITPLSSVPSLAQHPIPSNLKPPPTSPTMPQLLSEAIGADHDEFDVLYENIKNATDDAAKVRWRNQLTWTVARHAISEELTWYPAMEKHLGEEGTRLAKTDKEQHQGVSLYLTSLCYVWAKLTRWE
jgi:hypothetical protein